MGRLILRSSLGAAPPAEDISGLLFPVNGGAPEDTLAVAFKFTGAALIDPFPATYLWRFEPRQQAGFYTAFFWGNDGAFTEGYYGCHPYPPSGGDLGTSHKWELSTDGFDFVTDDNGHDTTVVKDGTSYAQALRVRQVGNELFLEFFWDLRDMTKVISVTTNSAFATQFPPPLPAFVWGTAPWRRNAENGHGVIRGIQQHEGLLSNGTIATLSALTTNEAVVAAAAASLWYVNLNPTPDDVSDKSGNGHHPTWQTALRPDLWTP